MKKMLLGTTMLATLMLAGAAQAADLPRKAPPPAPPPQWNWTGWYIGAHVGGGWGTKDWTDHAFCFEGRCEPAEGTFALTNQSVSGFLGGGQIGYNWQTNWFFGSAPVVLGIEADVSGSDIRGTSPCAIIDTCRTKVDSLGTIAARIGGVWDRALIYLKGGGAWVHDKHTRVDSDFDDFDSFSTTRWGWTIGGGIEYAFAPAWSAKLEYNFMDFGDKTFTTFRNVEEFESFRIRQTLHAVKIGLNYHFGWGGVAARY